MNTILILADTSCQLQNNLPDNVKDLILADNDGSFFHEVEEWDDTLIKPIWTGTEVVEDNVSLLVEAKEAKLKELKEAFASAENEDNQLMSSIQDCTFTVDSRRKDKDNIDTLTKMTEAAGGTTIDWVGPFETRTITLDEARTIYGEMAQCGMGLYSKKWGYEQAIAKATTVEEVEAISIHMKCYELPTPAV